MGRSNQLLAELLVHLGEVETRGIHRTRACSSLYAYCIYELRFSEDEAFRRVAAARLVRRFPALLDALASGELHLTGLLMLGPHLTETNLLEVLARAKHRTKRELARLVRMLDPLPAVPARIEPLGPAPARLVPREPSWQEFIASTCPVRELTPGDRPREWMESANDWGASSPEQGTMTAPESPERVDPTTLAAEGHHGALVEGPERYRVEFTAAAEYVHLVEEAKALLSHAVPNVPLEELHLRAMRALVAELKKKKYATVESSPARARDAETAEVPPRGGSGMRHQPTDAPDQAADQPCTRRRGRHIPAAVRRTVFERDGNRCSYVDAKGTRCPETHRLEFHHLKAFAKGGEHRASNLALRCTAHNALAAEEDFGRDRIEDRKNSLLHEASESFRG